MKAAAELDAYFDRMDGQQPAQSIPGLLPGEFWCARPVFALIRQAARSRRMPPDAVLGVMLAKVAFATPPAFVLPAVVGGYGSLNTAAVLVGPSGAGKGGSVAVADELLGTPLHVVSYPCRTITVGSGEGLSRAFFEEESVPGDKGRARKQWVRRSHGVLQRVNEAEELAKLMERAGSTLGTQMRQAISGEPLGMTNASRDNCRPTLDALTYRYVGIFGLQPELAKPILADAAGGTPQRLVWCATIDPDAPDDPPAWPGGIEWRPPEWRSDDPALVPLPGTYSPDVPERLRQLRPLHIADEIASEIRDLRLVQLRGGLVGLDGHRAFNQLKVAALLCLLDERLSVSTEDWTLAAMILRTSDEVRSQAAEVVEALARAASNGRVAEAKRMRVESDQAAGDAEEDAMERVEQVVLNRLRRSDSPPGGLTRRALKDAVGRDRRLLDEVLARLVDDAAVSRDDGPPIRWRAEECEP